MNNNYSSDSDFELDDKNDQKRKLKNNLKDYDNKITNKEVLKREKNKLNNRSFRLKKKQKPDEDQTDNNGPLYNVDDLNKSNKLLFKNFSFKS